MPMKGPACTEAPSGSVSAARAELDRRIWLRRIALTNAGQSQSFGVVKAIALPLDRGGRQEALHREVGLDRHQAPAHRRSLLVQPQMTERRQVGLVAAGECWVDLADHPPRLDR